MLKTESQRVQHRYYALPQQRRQGMKSTHKGLIAWHILAACYYLYSNMAGCDAAQTEGTTLMDLSWTFDESTIYWVTQKKLNFTVIHNGTDPSGTYWYQTDEISAGTHGGTHLDSPCHFALGRWCVSDIPLERLVVPAVVVDISHEIADNPDAHLTVNHLLKWERAEGSIPDGSLLLIRTGWSRYWPEPLKYTGTTERNASQLKFPSILPETGKWLAENRNIVGIGIDTMSIDIPNGMKETHRLLYDKNIYGLENVNLRKPLPSKGMKAYVMPMKLKDASGAPCRVVVEVSDGVESGNVGSGSSFTFIWTVTFLVAVWILG